MCNFLNGNGYINAYYNREKIVSKKYLVSLYAESIFYDTIFNFTYLIEKYFHKKVLTLNMFPENTYAVYKSRINE